MTTRPLVCEHPIDLDPFELPLGVLIEAANVDVYV
jgi:hypothetical protein